MTKKELKTYLNNRFKIDKRLTKDELFYDELVKRYQDKKEGGIWKKSINSKIYY
jgi:hypothetical protein